MAETTTSLQLDNDTVVKLMTILAAIALGSVVSGGLAAAVGYKAGSYLGLSAAGVAAASGGLGGAGGYAGSTAGAAVGGIAGGVVGAAVGGAAGAY